MKQDRRGSWYLLTGLVIGIGLGLVYSWVLSPVEYLDAPPYALRVDYKDDYRALVAAAYLYSGDLVRAKDRLTQLKDNDITQSLALQAQRAMTEGRPEGEIKALGILTMALVQGKTTIDSSIAPGQTSTEGSPIMVISPTPLDSQPADASTLVPQTSINPESVIATLGPTNTIPSFSEVTSLPPPGSPFVLEDTTLVCNPDQPQPMIQVQIQDAEGQPIAGVELVVTWEGGEDNFFTGLKPELGPGYADFLMVPGVVYSLTLVNGGQAASDLAAAECLSADQSQFWGSWMLTFIQP